MAIHIQGIRRFAPIPCINRAVGTGNSSGTVDMLGFQRALVVVQKELRTGQGGKVIARVAHNSAATAYSAGTAITGGILSSITNSLADYNCFNIDWTGKGRYLIVRASAVTASTTHGVTVYACDADKVPPSTTGFTQYKNLPNNP